MNGNPCANGGTCQTTIDGYSCICSPGFTGNTFSQSMGYIPGVTTIVKKDCMKVIKIENERNARMLL